MQNSPSSQRRGTKTVPENSSLVIHSSASILYPVTAPVNSFERPAHGLRVRDIYIKSEELPCRGVGEKGALTKPTWLLCPPNFACQKKILSSAEHSVPTQQIVISKTLFPSIVSTKNTVQWA
ncbi:hypothetical protein BC938DRAFT_473445 [Jimgerdemannia flammicorona]|uniref:Uncharacterized protein n=1 Tax=Jimgerdemannia flammicorona TaxID=994334 RepID=A0A433Q3Z6_9FUNG|nr:hypothetical protein BC938DRAFT_473445 [Jimgerdemannia flammicorona]